MSLALGEACAPIYVISFGVAIVQQNGVQAIKENLVSNIVGFCANVWLASHQSSVAKASELAEAVCVFDFAPTISISRPLVHRCRSYMYTAEYRVVARSAKLVLDRRCMSVWGAGADTTLQISCRAACLIETNGCREGPWCNL